MDPWRYNPPNNVDPWRYNPPNNVDPWWTVGFIILLLSQFFVHFVQYIKVKTNELLAI
jgi:hypothetical protein